MKIAPFSPDLREFLALLRRHRVRYVIVGGEAVIYHGYARLTGDLDLFFDASPTNAERLYHALLEFWAGSIPSIATAADLRVRSTVFRFGVPPNRLELLNAIDGVSFEAAWNGRETARIHHHGLRFPVHFLGLNELIRNKRAAGRNKDLDDLRYLLEARRRRDAHR